MELIKLDKSGTAYVDSLAIADGADNAHKAVIQLIRDNIEDLKEFGRVTFEMAPFQTAGGTQIREVALLNEQQCTLLFTYMRNSEKVKAFKIRLVKAFYELRSGKSQQLDYGDPSVIAGVITTLDAKVKKQAEIIQEQAPKVDFYDSYLNADGLYGLQNAARALNCRPNLFTRWLKSKFVFYQGAALVAKVQYIQMGLFEVKTTIIDDRARPQSFITPKGLKYLDERVPSDIRVIAA